MPPDDLSRPDNRTPQPGHDDLTPQPPLRRGEGEQVGPSPFPEAERFERAGFPEPAPASYLASPPGTEAIDLMEPPDCPPLSAPERGLGGEVVRASEVTRVQARRAIEALRAGVPNHDAVLALGG